MSEAQQIGQWVPPALLAALVIAATGVILLLLRYMAGEFVRRLVVIELDVRSIASRLPSLATTEQLSNMGERLNTRISELANHTGEQIADLRERMKVLESAK